MKIHHPYGAGTERTDAAATTRSKVEPGRAPRNGASETRPEPIDVAEGVTLRISSAATERADDERRRFDVERVERLRAALEKGALQVDSTAVACRMVPDEEGDAS